MKKVLLTAVALICLILFEGFEANAINAMSNNTSIASELNNIDVVASSVSIIITDDAINPEKPAGTRNYPVKRLNLGGSKRISTLNVKKENLHGFSRPKGKKSLNDFNKKKRTRKIFKKI